MSIDGVSELLFWLVFALLWWLFFFPLRDYRVDETRQRLFEIRARLFDAAWSAGVGESKAHRMTRQTINGLIRYSHVMTLMGFLVVYFRWSKNYADIEQRSHREDFDIAMENISVEQREIFFNAIRSVHAVYILHLIKISPITFPVYLVVWLMRELSIFRWIRDKLLESSPVSALDDFAYSEGRRRFAH